MKYIVPFSPLDTPVTCDEKRGTLRRKEGDGNVWKKEKRKT